MANLNNKVLEFKRHFNITEDFRDDKVFKLDPRGNLITVWNNKDYYLTIEEIQLSFYLNQQCNIR